MTGQRQRLLRLSPGGLVRRVLLACTLGLFASLFLSAEAQAHGLHAGIIVSDAVEAADDVAGKTSAYAAECETTCCSPISCASALASLAETSPGFDARLERFARPKDARAAGFSLASLRRPPRA